MKIGISLFTLNPDYIGGTSVYAKALLNNVLRLANQHEYYILVSPKNRPYIQNFANNINYTNGPNANFISINYSKTFPARVTRFIDRNLPIYLREKVINQEAKRIKNKIDALELDIVHFPLTTMYPLKLATPTVLNPHDIQHEHYPEYFSKKALMSRRQTYIPSCKKARAIIVASRFVKDDLIRHYEITPEKIHVVTLAPDKIFEQEISVKEKSQIKQSLDLPDRFIYYPAQIWPHKNHINLVRGLVIIRKTKNELIPLVLSGSKMNGFKQLEVEVEKQGLRNQVHYLGKVDFKKLPAIYSLADFIVFPSLFEASSFPIMEAFTVGTPVVASNIPPFLELAQNSALFFNPKDPEDIADKIYKVWSDQELRKELAVKATNRAKQFNWIETVEKIIKVYKKAAEKS